MQVLESCVKNCGSLVHEEIATRPFMEELRDLLKHTTDDNTKQKILEMLQTWGMAFRNSPRYRIVTVSHLTTGFWGKEAWCPTPKWNTRFFFAFSKRTQLWLPMVWRKWENFFGKAGKREFEGKGIHTVILEYFNIKE